MKHERFLVYGKPEEREVFQEVDGAASVNAFFMARLDGMPLIRGNLSGKQRLCIAIYSANKDFCLGKGSPGLLIK